MPTTLDEFYQRLDALDVNNTQELLKFGHYLHKMLKNEFKNAYNSIRLEKDDLVKAGLIRENDAFNENEVNRLGNKEYDNVKFSKFVASFLGSEKVDIDRVIKLAKVKDYSNTYPMQIQDNQQFQDEFIAWSEQLYSSAVSLGEYSDRQTIVSDTKEELLRNPLLMSEQGNVIANQIEQLNQNLQSLKSVLTDQKEQLINQLIRNLKALLQTEKVRNDKEQVTLIDDAINKLTVSGTLDELSGLGKLGKLPEDIQADNKKLSEYSNKIRKINSAMRNLSNNSPVSDNDVNNLDSPEIEELNKRLKELTAKPNAIKKSLADLDNDNYVRDQLSRSSTLKAFLTPGVDMQNDPNCYQLRTQYLIGKNLVMSELKELFNNIISKTSELNDKLPPTQKREVASQLEQLQNNFNAAERTEDYLAIIGQARQVQQQVRQAQQSVEFHAEIRQAKNKIGQLYDLEDSKGIKNGNHYLKSLVDCFDAEKSFDERNKILTTAINTNKYLDAKIVAKKNPGNQENVTAEKNAQANLEKSAENLKHSSASKKVRGALKILLGVGVALVVTGAIGVATGGVGLLAAAAAGGAVGAGAVFGGKDIKDSEKSVKSHAKQAFFQPAKLAASVKKVDAHSDNNAGVASPEKEEGPPVQSRYGKI